jgi:hypothetical protein
MLMGGPYQGHFISVTDPGEELRIAMFESNVAALYTKRGELDATVPFMVTGSYGFVDLIDSAQSLNLRPPAGIHSVAGEYDPTFLTLTREERRRRKHGKRTAIEADEGEAG